MLDENPLDNILNTLSLKYTVQGGVVYGRSDQVMWRQPSRRLDGALARLAEFAFATPNRTESVKSPSVAGAFLLLVTNGRQHAILSSIFARHAQSLLWQQCQHIDRH